MTIRLGVNIDHIATLRQQRKEGFPDPVEAALAAQAHGADSIVAHLREDRRHIQDDDLRQLKMRLRIPLAMEMGATEEMVRSAGRLRPTRVCLVPEKRQELTTEGGLDVLKQGPRLVRLIQPLLRMQIEVSVFVDPIPTQIVGAKAIGAQTVELHTGVYSRARGAARQRELKRLRESALIAGKLGMQLHAGHGLDYDNVKAVAALPGMQELNIGFAIIARALEVGIGNAVREMKNKI